MMFHKNESFLNHLIRGCQIYFGSWVIFTPNFPFFGAAFSISSNLLSVLVFIHSFPSFLPLA